MTTAISSLVLGAPELATAEEFYERLGLDDRIRVQQSDEPTSGFRGYTLSLVCAQPANVDAYVAAAVEAGATVLKPGKRSFWGYGAVVQAPDGAIWKLATSSKKDTAPAAREHDHLVLLLGVDDVRATKRFYVDQGLEVTKSFGGKYAELRVAEDGVQLSLYPRRAAAKDAGVDPTGSGSHRLVVHSDLGDLTDPDGYVWERAEARRAR